MYDEKEVPLAERLATIRQQRLSAEAKTLPPCGYPRCLELQQCIRDGVKRGSRECRRRAATSA